MSTELNRCTIYLRPDMVKDLDAIISRKDNTTSRSSIIREILDDYIIKDKQYYLSMYMHEKKKEKEDAILLINKKGIINKLSRLFKFV